MKVFNVVFIIVFIVSAALQYNDPDPYVWMPLYLYGAFLCYQALKKKYHPVLYVIGLSGLCQLCGLFIFRQRRCGELGKRTRGREYCPKHEGNQAMDRRNKGVWRIGYFNCGTCLQYGVVKEG